MGMEMMDPLQLRWLRFFALLFVLPGLGGLLLSASVSTQFMQSLPREPVPSELRYFPRNINGIVVYQTKDEDRRLSVLEDTSVGVFLVGLSLGLVYLRQWGLAYAISAEEDEYAEDAP